MTDRFEWDVEKEKPLGSYVPFNNEDQLQTCEQKTKRLSSACIAFLVEVVLEGILLRGTLDDFRSCERREGCTDQFVLVTISPWNEIYKSFSRLYPEFDLLEIKRRYMDIERKAVLNLGHRRHYARFLKKRLEVFCRLRNDMETDILYAAESKDSNSWSCMEDSILVGILFTVLYRRGSMPYRDDEWDNVHKMYVSSYIEGVQAFVRSKQDIKWRWQFLSNILRTTKNGFCPYVWRYLQAGVKFPKTRPTTNRQNPTRECRKRKRGKQK